jgi:cell shape-determining protein MreC
MNNQQGVGAPAEIVNSARQGLSNSKKSENQIQKENESLLPSPNNDGLDPIVP